MSAFNKTVSTDRSPKDVFELLMTACSLHGIQVLESNASDGEFRVRARKTYKPSTKFRWGIAAILFGVGLVLTGIVSAQTTPENDTDAITILLPLAVYLTYFFVRARGKVAEFDFAGITNSQDGTDTSVNVSEGLDEAKSEANSVLMTL